MFRPHGVEETVLVIECETQVLQAYSLGGFVRERIHPAEEGA